jgi:phage terminase small subunit
MTLSKKQELFCKEYLVDMNATQAYKRAGYSVKSDNAAAVEAFKLLRNPKIDIRIKELMDERSKRTEITADWVLNELYAIAKAKGTDYAQVVEEPMIVNGSYVMDPDTGQLKTWESVRITPTDKLPEDKQKAIAGIKMGKNGIEVSTCDKVRALELLGKHLGMFTDNIKLKSDANTEVTIKIGGEAIED